MSELISLAQKAFPLAKNIKNVVDIRDGEDAFKQLAPAIMDAFQRNVPLETFVIAKPNQLCEELIGGGETRDIGPAIARALQGKKVVIGHGKEGAYAISPHGDYVVIRSKVNLKK